MSRFTVISIVAVTDHRISSAQLRTLLAIGSYTNEIGWCKPGLKTLGKMLGKSPQAVSKDIQHLSELGYVEIEPRTRPNGARTSNGYRLLFDDPPQLPVDIPSTSKEIEDPSTSKEIEIKLRTQGKDSGEEKITPMHAYELLTGGISVKSEWKKDAIIWMNILNNQGKLTLKHLQPYLDNWKYGRTHPGWLERAVRGLETDKLEEVDDSLLITA